MLMHYSYTRAVILELLRYTTVGPLGLPHETVCDTKYKDYSIPKGVYVSVYSIVIALKLYKSSQFLSKILIMNSTI